MSRARPAQPTMPPSGPRGVLCPYCGTISANPKRCDRCSGHFDPLSRQATQNAMGPWFIRDVANPSRPGCSFETLRDMIKRGKVTQETILKGPTTRQFWNFAARTPSVANLLGLCHNCHSEVSPEAYSCGACGAVFSPETDRQHLGLAPVHLLPGQASPEIIAAASVEPEEERGPVRASKPLAAGKYVAPEPLPEARWGSRPIIIAMVALVLLGLAAAFILMVAKPWAATPGVPGTPPRGTPPAPKAVAPASPAPAHTNEPAVQPPAKAAPKAEPTPASEDAPGNPVSPATEPKMSALILERLTAEPPDVAGALAAIRAEPGGPAAEEWAALVGRREAQLRLRRLP
jgi:hypothetical protein